MSHEYFDLYILYFSVLSFIREDIQNITQVYEKKCTTDISIYRGFAKFCRTVHI